MKLKKPVFIVGILLGMLQFGCGRTITINGVPVTVGTPEATATPASTEVTTPSPSAVPITPEPSDTPVVRVTPAPTSIPRPSGPFPWKTTCDLPAHPSPDNCTKTTPGEVGKFRKLVFQAMQTVFTKYPGLFYNKGTQACPWEVPTVEKRDLYYWNVELESKAIYDGLCIQFDGENIQVKMDNGYEEQYHPLRTDGDVPPSHCVSDVNGIYVFHCTPSTF